MRADAALGLASEQRRGAGKAQRRADDMARAQPLARQQRREQHDQQRPEICDEARFGGRRAAQRGEIERVIAEQAADPDEPDRPGLGEGGEAPARGRVDQPEGAADGEGQRRQLERRNRAGGGGEQRQHAP